MSTRCQKPDAHRRRSRELSPIKRNIVVGRKGKPSLCKWFPLESHRLPENTIIRSRFFKTKRKALSSRTFLFFFILQGFPWVIPNLLFLVCLGSLSFVRLGSEEEPRLGEVESWYHRQAMIVAAIECCEESTSPSPLLTKEGNLRTISHTLYPC